MSDNHWGQWLDNQNVPADQMQLLADALKDRGTKNGHNITPSTNTGVQILRPPIEDYLLNKCPPYVDINKLINIYNKLAFRYNLLVKGPKGDGKSLSVSFYCKETKTPLVTMECSEETKGKELIGAFPHIGMFQLGKIPEAIDIANEYGRAVLLFEELNGLTPQVQKMLNAILDFRKFITVPQIGKTYKLKEGAQLWCMATMNPAVYGGTYELNEDLRSRWIELEVGYPSHDQEKDIVKAHFPDMDEELEKTVDKCIRLASDTRQQGTGYALSTRDLVDLVGLIQVMSLQDALQLTVCKFEGEDREVSIKRVSSNFAGIKPKKHWGASQ